MPRTNCVIAGFALTSLLLLTGCGSGDDGGQELTDDQPEVVDNVHEHSHELGPNGGHLIELGEEEYHAELLFDPETRMTTVYILDGEAKSPHPIKAETINLDLEGDGEEIEFTLDASPLEGEDEGMSSRFKLAADKLPESIKDVEDIKGHMHITIGEKEFTGDIKHEHEEGE